LVLFGDIIGNLFSDYRYSTIGSSDCCCVYWRFWT